jgi:hypothetical protein
VSVKSVSTRPELQKPVRIMREGAVQEALQRVSRQHPNRS